MSDELKYIQSELVDVISRVKSANPNSVVLTSSVFYRDENDEYLTRESNFTTDINQTKKFILDQKAGGGGNGAQIWGAVAQGAGSLIGNYLGSCWVARAAWGAENPRWLEFRASMFAHAPEWFVEFYLANGEKIARHIHTPARRAFARIILSTLQRLWTPTSNPLPA
jgi:hypothetical protein